MTMIEPRLRTYKLVDRVAVPCESMEVFMEAFMERAMAIQATGEDPWRVGYDDLGGGRTISTVFLGLDQNHFGSGPPRLFETAALKKGNVDIVGLCATWEQAEEQHAGAVKVARTHLRVVK